MPYPSNSISDQELLVLSQRGDKQAFGYIYERYLDEIYRYIFFRVKDEVEAEDLTEQVFIKAWVSLHKRQRKNQIENLRAWIYRIAHNLVIDHYRSRKNNLPLNEQTVFSKSHTNPEQAAVYQSEKDQLKAVLNSLDENLKQVVLLRFVSQLSHAETAEILGLKESHIRVLQHRALKKIRLLLEEE